MKQICSRSGQGFVMLLLRSLAQMLVGLIMCWAYYLFNLAVVLCV